MGFSGKTAWWSYPLVRWGPEPEPELLTFSTLVMKLPGYRKNQCRSRILDRLELLDYFRQAMKDGRHANYCPSNHIYSIFIQV